MILRQSNNQRSGGIAAHPIPKFPSAKIRWKISRLDFFCDQDGILPIDYLPKGQIINSEYYLSLLVKIKDILKEKSAGRSPRWSCTKMPRFNSTCNPEETGYLDFQCLDHPPYSPDLAPSDYHLFLELKKIIECSPLFVRRGGHCCRGDLVGWTKF